MRLQLIRHSSLPASSRRCYTWPPTKEAVAAATEVQKPRSQTGSNASAASGSAAMPPHDDLMARLDSPAFAHSGKET